MSFARSRLPIRWRLAGGSALLTLVILLGFAVIVGMLTSRQMHRDFDDRVRSTANQLAERIVIRPGANAPCVGPNLNDVGATSGSAIRVMTLSGEVLCRSRGAPDLGFPREEPAVVSGYRVESRLIEAPPLGRAVLQYGRPMAEIEPTLDKVRFFLLLGVLGGTGLALLAGLLVARRAMAPIAELTSAAREIERTRDPSRRVPHPRADDEVAELARTLEGMLQALDSARGETEAALARQREFVADASHELRTPLTSVLANLELLHEELEGDQAEVAGSALRSSQRMRRLVSDLLLLARADAGRPPDPEPVDLGTVLEEAARELRPLAGEHLLALDAHPAPVRGSPDELHRLAGNLLENAVRHTPGGTRVTASVRQDGDRVLLSVEDDGPGLPPDLDGRIFERFARAGGDAGGGSGLGLAIVRAVAESHGGSARAERPKAGGTRFVVELPAAATVPPAPDAESQTSTTTGSTIGRRLSRS